LLSASAWHNSAHPLSEIYSSALLFKKSYLKSGVDLQRAGITPRVLKSYVKSQFTGGETETSSRPYPLTIIGRPHLPSRLIRTTAQATSCSR
jgi:hypothetical protein